MTGAIETCELAPTCLTCGTCRHNLAVCSCTIEDFLPGPVLLANVPGTLIIDRRPARELVAA